MEVDAATQQASLQRMGVASFHSRSSTTKLQTNEMKEKFRGKIRRTRKCVVMGLETNQRVGDTLSLPQTCLGDSRR